MAPSYPSNANGNRLPLRAKKNSASTLPLSEDERKVEWGSEASYHG
jgi:hypothetical protein